MNIHTLTDDELATCVDEFVKRAINHARATGYNNQLTVSIIATQFSEDGEYTIEQKATVGEAWNTPYISNTNNLVHSVDNAVARWLADQLNEPTVVRPMIEHKPELHAVEDNDDVQY